MYSSPAVLFSISLTRRGSSPIARSRQAPNSHEVQARIRCLTQSIVRRSALARHRLVHVGFVEEPVERQQLDQARIRGEQLRAPLPGPQLAIAARRFDEQRQVVAFGGERADQLAREMKNAALVVRLAERLADNQDLHALFSSSSNGRSEYLSSGTVRTMRP